MVDAVDVAYVELALRGQAELKARMEAVKGEVKKQFDEINREAVVKVGGPGGDKSILRQIQSTVGRGSEFGLGAKLLAGGGALAGLEALGGALSKIGAAGQEAAKGMREGEYGIVGATLKVAEAIPVYGSLHKGAQAVASGIYDLNAAYEKGRGASKEYYESLLSYESQLALALERSAKLDRADKLKGDRGALKKEIGIGLEKATLSEFDFRRKEIERAEKAKLDELRALYGGLANVDDGFGNNPAKMAAQVRETANRQRDQVYAEEQAARDAASLAQAQPVLKAREEQKKADEERKASIKQMTDALEEQITKAREGEDALLVKKFAGLTQDKAQIEAYAKKVALVREAKNEEEERREIARQADQDRSRAKSLVEGARTAREKLAEDLKEVRRLRDSGALSDVDAKRIGGKWIDEANAKAAMRKVSLQDAGSFASSFQAALSSGVTETKAMEQRRLELAKRNAEATKEVRDEIKGLREDLRQSRTTTRPRA